MPAAGRFSRRSTGRRAGGRSHHGRWSGSSRSGSLQCRIRNELLLRIDALDPAPVCVGDWAIESRDELGERRSDVPLPDSGLHAVNALMCAGLAAGVEAVPADGCPSGLPADSGRGDQQAARSMTLRIDERARPTGRGSRSETRPSQLRRSAERDRDRASLVSRSLVAGDVRARAVQALEHLPRRASRRELIGYLVCSRYHTVWHLMNVAVDTNYRRRGSRRR